MTKTPEQVWKESIQKYKKKCQIIMGISEHIRYTGIINKYGRTLTGIIRPGIKPLLKSQQAKNEFFILSMLITLRTSNVKVFGKFDYGLIKHNNVTILILHKQDVVYYISIDSKAESVDEIITRIKKLS